MSLIKNRQALFALLLIVLDVGYFAQSLTLPRPFQLGEPGPAFLPIVLSIVLLISCLGVLWHEYKGTARHDLDGEGPSDLKITFRSILLVVVTGLFVWVFEPLGYWISTFIYTSTVAWLFERERTGAAGKSLVTALVIGAGVTIVGYLFFVTLFGLGLPAGLI